MKVNKIKGNYVLIIKKNPRIVEVLFGAQVHNVSKNKWVVITQIRYEHLYR